MTEFHIWSSERVLIIKFENGSRERHRFSRPTEEPQGRAAHVMKETITVEVQETCSVMSPCS